MTPSDIQRIRDAIHVCLMVREGRIITEDVARERANNTATALMPMIDDLIAAALKEAARGVVVGEIKSRYHFDAAIECPGCGSSNSIQRGTDGLCFCTSCKYAFDMKGDDDA